MCLLPFATWAYERVFSHINYEAVIASLHLYPSQMFLFYTLDCVKITKKSTGKYKFFQQYRIFIQTQS